MDNRRRATSNKRLLLLATAGVLLLLSILHLSAPPSLPSLNPFSPSLPSSTSHSSSASSSRWSLSSLNPFAAHPNAPLKSALFPVPDPTRTHGGVWIDENNRQLRALFACIEADNCGVNQGKVIILGSHHFKGGLWGWTGGEDIWARSVILALKSLGYTHLYAESLPSLQTYHTLFPSLITAILLEPSQVTACHSQPDTCLLSPQNPDGVPSWKMLSFFFWAQANHPLGAKWTLAPERYAREWGGDERELQEQDAGKGGNTYLGYSLEPTCMQGDAYVETERRWPLQAYAMAKKWSYFAVGSDTTAWGFEEFEAAAEASRAISQSLLHSSSNTSHSDADKETEENERARGLETLIGIEDDRSEPSNAHLSFPSSLPPSMRNVGLLEQAEFMRQVGRSRVLVGVGRPITSPTPYEALCLGVPFINPILDWKKADPSDRRYWTAQHGTLKLLDPPLVYNVFKGDKQGFVDAVVGALEVPIGRTILPEMEQSAVEARLHAILSRDWRAEAQAVMDERRRTGVGEIFMI